MHVERHGSYGCEDQNENRYPNLGGIGFEDVPLSRLDHHFDGRATGPVQAFPLVPRQLDCLFDQLVEFQRLDAFALAFAAKVLNSANNLSRVKRADPARFQMSPRTGFEVVAKESQFEKA